MQIAYDGSQLQMEDILESIRDAGFAADLLSSKSAQPKGKVDFHYKHVHDNDVFLPIHESYFCAWCVYLCTIHLLHAHLTQLEYIDEVVRRLVVVCSLNYFCTWVVHACPMIST